MYQDTKQKTSNEIVLLHGICRFCRPVVDGDIDYMVGILSNLEMAQHFTVSNCCHQDSASEVVISIWSWSFAPAVNSLTRSLRQKRNFGCLRFVDEDVICLHEYGIVSRTCFGMMLNLTMW